MLDDCWAENGSRSNSEHSWFPWSPFLDPHDLTRIPLNFIRIHKRWVTGFLSICISILASVNFRSEIRSDSSLRSNSGSWPRIGRSASDAQFYDTESTSKLITNSFTGSPVHSSREDMIIGQPGSTTFMPQSNGGHKIHNVEPAYDSDDGEVRILDAWVLEFGS